ncbi:MAG: AraC family ligand binding domain-containing protein [Treponema sp.]|nr:AraC family ligand binding domain-containing protein [Treponema sp.]
MNEELLPEIYVAVFRQCTPHWNMPKQAIAHWNITYVVQGRAQYRINGEEYALAAGDVLCLPPGAIREALTFSDNLMQCFSIDFGLINLKKEAAHLSLPVLHHLSQEKRISQLFHELSFIWLDKQPGYKIRTRALFLLILFHLQESFFGSSSAGGGEGGQTDVSRP